MQAESEKVLYAIALYTGTGIEEPDYLATVDVDPSSPTSSQFPIPENPETCTSSFRRTAISQ
jgi:hypothetical protein